MEHFFHRILPIYKKKIKIIVLGVLLIRPKEYEVIYYWLGMPAVVKTEAAAG